MAFPPTIRENDSGPNVSWAQYLLCRATLLQSSRAIDGRFGPQTKAAVEEFQGDEGIAVDGVVGPVTWGKLGGDRPEPPTLSEGSRGPVVEKLQTTFNGLGGDFGFNGPPLAVDGIDGPKTTAAVRAAQGHEGLTVDGIVGLQTWGIATGDAGNTLASHCGVTPPFI